MVDIMKQLMIRHDKNFDCYDDIIHKAVEENFFYNIIHKPYFNKLNREIILNLNVYNSLRFNLYKIKK